MKSKKFKAVIMCSLYLGTCSVVIPPIGIGLGFAFKSSIINNNKACVHPPIEKIVKRWNVDKVVKKFEALKIGNFDVPDVLNLSYLIVTTHLKYELNEATKENFAIDYSLRSGEGVCDEFAYFTSTIYQYLISRAGKKDFQSKVRIVEGVVEHEPSGDIGFHAWLEYLENENTEWKIYETTRMSQYFNKLGALTDLLGTGIETKEDLKMLMEDYVSDKNEYTKAVILKYLDNRYMTSLTLNAFSPVMAYKSLSWIFKVKKTRGNDPKAEIRE